MTVLRGGRTVICICCERKKKMNKALILMADGFEEIEGLAVVDILRRGGITIDMVSIYDNSTIKGSHDIVISSDKNISDINEDEYDIIIIPGGQPGTNNIKGSDKAKEMILHFYSAGKYVAAICAAPTVLGMLGILEGKRACCYEGLENGLTGAVISYDNVVKDGKIITSRGMGTAVEFGLAILSAIKGDDAGKAMSKAIMIKEK